MSFFKKLFNKPDAERQRPGRSMSEVEIKERGIKIVENGLSRQLTSSHSTFNMRVIIRGDRGTGKSSLFARLQGFPLDAIYKATSEIEVANINWSYKTADDVVKVEVWDVVDKAIDKGDFSAAESKIAASRTMRSGKCNVGGLDADAVDVYHGTNVCIFMVNILKPMSLEYVRRELPNVPRHVFVIILANFYDQAEHRLVSRDDLKSLRSLRGGHRIRFIDCCMVDMYGMAELHRAFNEPFMTMKVDNLEKKLMSLRTELSTAVEEIDICVKEQSYSAHKKRFDQSRQQAAVKAASQRPAQKPAPQKQQAPDNSKQSRSSQSKSASEKPSKSKLSSKSKDVLMKKGKHDDVYGEIDESFLGSSDDDSENERLRRRLGKIDSDSEEDVGGRGGDVLSDSDSDSASSDSDARARRVVKQSPASARASSTAHRARASKSPVLANDDDIDSFYDDVPPPPVKQTNTASSPEKRMAETKSAVNPPKQTSPPKQHSPAAATSSTKPAAAPKAEEYFRTVQAKEKQLAAVAADVVGGGTGVDDDFFSDDDDDDFNDGEYNPYDEPAAPAATGASSKQGSAQRMILPSDSDDSSDDDQRKSSSALPSFLQPTVAKTTWDRGSPLSSDGSDGEEGGGGYGDIGGGAMEPDFDASYETGGGGFTGGDGLSEWLDGGGENSVGGGDSDSRSSRKKSSSKSGKRSSRHKSEDSEERRHKHKSKSHRHRSRSREKSRSKDDKSERRKSHKSRSEGEKKERRRK